MSRHPATSPSVRERLRTQLADLKMPGALEALDDIRRRCDAGELTASDAIAALLGSHIELRNARRLQTAMRSARLPAVKTLGDFDFSFQPSLKREQIEHLHTLGFIERKENVVLLGPPGVGKTRISRCRSRSLRPKAVAGSTSPPSPTCSTRSRRPRPPAGSPRGSGPWSSPASW
jgi:DNA replication protein DnaC